MDVLQGLILATLAGMAAPREPPPMQDRQQPPLELDRIVVTARRREESLQAVPGAVTAASGDELEARGAQDVSALGALTPNLVAYPSRAFNGSLTTYIRGVGQGDPAWGVEPGVGVYIDDVFIARPQGALLDILDVERVEVLRGPQGTLYGRNTLGGAIRFITREPQAGVSASSMLTVGDYARREARSLLNLPLGERLFTRIALGKFERGGYGRNLLTGEAVSARDALAVRLGATWLPRDDLKVRVAFDRLLDQSGMQSFKRLTANPFDPARTPPDPGNFDVRNGVPNLQDLEASGGSVTVEWTLAGGRQLRSISAYRIGESQGFIDFDSLPQTISTLQRHFDERQVSQEFQLLWAGADTHGIAGMYWMDGDAGGTGFNTARTPGLGVTTGSVRTRSLAGYANLTRDLGRDWALELGARYTREQKSGTVFNARYADASQDPATASINADFTRSKTFDDLSPRASLSWRVRPDLLLYAQASRGFKAGTFNVRANERLFPQSALPLEDESVTALELGAKGRWLDGRLQLNAALFHNRYQDIQLSVFTAYDSNGDGVDDAVFGDFRNAGEGAARGVELETTLRLGRFLQWRAHGGFLDTRYSRYYSGGVDLADGKRFANAPRWNAGNSLVLDLPLHSGGWLLARLDGRLQAKVYPTAELEEAMAQPAYAVWSASLAWTSPQQHWHVAVRGENLSNTAYRVTGFSFPTLGILTGHYGPPRNWSLSLRWSY